MRYDFCKNCDYLSDTGECVDPKKDYSTRNCYVVLKEVGLLGTDLKFIVPKVLPKTKEVIEQGRLAHALYCRIIRKD